MELQISNNQDDLIQITDHSNKGLIKAYLLEKKEIHNKQSTTIITYKNILNLFGRSLDKSFKDANAFDVVSFIKPMKDSEKSPLTINHYISVIKGFYDFLVYYKQCDTNIAQRIGKEAVEDKIYKDLVEQDQVRDIYLILDSRIKNTKNKITHIRNEVFFDIMLKTGIRQISAFRLRIGDFKQKQGRYILEYEPKGKKTKKVAILAPNTVKRLFAYLQMRTDGNEPKSPLFSAHARSSKVGDTFSTKSMRDFFRKLFIDAGLILDLENDKNRLTGHSLRHTHGCIVTMMMGEAYAQRELGHATAQMTRNYTKKLHENERFNNRPDLDGFYGS